MKKRSKRVKFTSAERQQIWERTNGICYICRGIVPIDNFHVDHVIPLYLGGTNDLSNLLPVHPVCNLVKGKKVI